MIASNPETRKTGIEFLKKVIRIISKLRGDVLCGVLYAGWGELKDRMRTQEEWEHAKNGLLEVADVAKQHRVVLALEPVNRFEGYFLNTAKDALKLVKEIGHPNIKIHLDTFQMNIEEKNLTQPIKTVEDELHHLHFCANHRGTPGTGHIPWRDIFKSLKEIEYDNWGVIEAWIPQVFLFGEGKIPRKIAMWREIATDGRKTAKKGLDFLKKVEKEVLD
ncbi:hypothetical protein AKJ65_00105 [candidate division MSBL1 archaeon SCGC-AAA259E19]|uniref:Xylose isomerase-like TIM barrel domain-containing protein n=1 Tax=candidate division MSBL1 archaeon SCGC-AAA259E19 TaxID=1698264 RepID=A0A133UNS8_9EURY|nr:hypothetical protein AKJ65_00105 [candidate division MSBL1 archaeon SCGC-AAA259E19]